MLKVDFDGILPRHIDRLEPAMSVDDTGKVIWAASLIDYDPMLFYRGKKVTNEEFNELFLQQAYQGNYIADSLTTFFDKHLGPAIHRRFTSTFNLAPSFVKTFTPDAWGEKQADGYYYITIPATEHGLQPNNLEENTALNKISITAEMNLLSNTGQFYEVPQVEIDEENTVRVYTDDNTVSGFVIVRMNDKAYTVAAAIVDATQIQGLATVAVSARYTDLVDINAATGPNTRIAANATDIQKILSGERIVAHAVKSDSSEYADYTHGLLLEGTIQGIPVANIFEEGSSHVKVATRATQGALEITAESLEPPASKAVYDYIGSLITANALDIENGVENKLATAKAIKEFMEEYYMKAVVGTYQNVGTYASDRVMYDSTPNYYLVKRGNVVDLTLLFGTAKADSLPTKDYTKVAVGQLSAGFYNENTVIHCVALHSSQEYGRVTASITNTGLITINMIDAGDKVALEDTPYLNLHFQYIVEE